MRQPKPEPNETFLEWMSAVTAVLFAGVYLTAMILLGLSMERHAEHQIAATWHETVATSFGPPIIDPSGGSTSTVRYGLDGRSYTAVLPWRCFAKAPQPAGTLVWVYASTSGSVYCSPQDSGVPRAEINPALAVADVFGTVLVAAPGAALGWGLAVLSWYCGWWIGERVGPERTK